MIFLIYFSYLLKSQIWGLNERNMNKIVKNYSFASYQFKSHAKCVFKSQLINVHALYNTLKLHLNQF